MLFFQSSLSTLESARNKDSGRRRKGRGGGERGGGRGEWGGGRGGGKGEGEREEGGEEVTGILTATCTSPSAALYHCWLAPGGCRAS